MALIGVLGAPLLAVGAPVADAGETPTCFGEPATIVVSEPGGDVVGTESADVMVVTDTDFWTVYGLGGYDRINRRGPRDDDPHLSPLMRSGSGDDRLEGGANMDHILGGRGRDRIFGGSLWDGLRGGRGKDVIHGEGRGGRMYGGESADRLVDWAGRDSARGGPGVDTCDAELEFTC